MNNELSELVSDEKINKVWANANFGDISKRDVIKDALLQIAGGFSTGGTAAYILKELGLIRTSGEDLTKMGRRYLFYAFHPKANPTSPSHTGTADNDMTAEEFFNDPGGMFTLDFLSEEERQTIYKAIDLFVKGKLRMADRTTLNFKS